MIIIITIMVKEAEILLFTVIIIISTNDYK